MMRTTTLTLLALAATTGCNLGFGTPYPGAATRYRNFYSCGSVSGSVCYDARLESETGGGGKHGYVAGMSMGADDGSVGDRTAGGIAFDIRGEYAYSLSNWASVGAFAGIGFTAGSIAKLGTGTGTDEMDPDFSAKRIPLGGKLTLAPTPPIILTAGAFVAPTSLKVADQDSVSTTAFGWTAGAGISLPFPGLHFVMMFEWQHHRSSDITLDTTTGNYGADLYLLSYWLVL